MPVSRFHDRRGMRRLAPNRRHRSCPARLLSHRFGRLWPEDGREQPHECGYQKQMPEQGASPCCDLLAGPTFGAVCRGPKTTPKATNPGFQQHGRSEDELGRGRRFLSDSLQPAPGESRHRGHHQIRASCLLLRREWPSQIAPQPGREFLYRAT